MDWCCASATILRGGETKKANKRNALAQTCAPKRRNVMAISEATTPAPAGEFLLNSMRLVLRSIDVGVKGTGFKSSDYAVAFPRFEDPY